MTDPVARSIRRFDALSLNIALCHSRGAFGDVCGRWAEFEIAFPGRIFRMQRQMLTSLRCRRHALLFSARYGVAMPGKDGARV